MADTAARTQKTEEQNTNPSQSIERRTIGTLNPLLTPTAAEFSSGSPFALMRRLAEDMDRTFAGFWDTQRQGSLEESLAWRPNVEVRQSGDNLVVRAELPGLTDKDIHVEVVDDGLLIQGERKRVTSVKDGSIQHSEVNYGKFMRLIPLPEGANVDRAKANFSNGILEVDIPNPQPQVQNRRQIPVTTSK